MANLSNEEINKIRNSVNIVDIIGSNINLEKKGKNYFGLCPFHDDHTPSLSVSEEKQIYTCFVCGATGNTFSFLMDYENISFMEAVNKVATISGISLSKEITYTKKYDKEYKIYDLATKYYKNNLKSELGKSAIEYLNNRNIDERIIDEFDIGVALSDNNLSKLLLEKKYDEKMIVDIGIANKGDTIYDVFRNRIMFPIHNSNGNVVAFSGRVYNNEVDNKYINTKETYIFKKGEVLFNYHRAYVEARKKKTIIICEGQMDAIRIYSSGIKNVIATMGTALTKDHINLIKKLNSKIILNMDSDNAGINAAIVNGDLLKNAGLDVYIVSLEGAKDPDEFITKYGVDKYKDSINHSTNLFDFKLNYLKHNKNLDNPDELSNYINSVIKELNKSNDDILKNITINKLSEEYKIDKNILLSKIEKSQKDVIPNVIKLEKKISKNIKAVEEILYYMMNNVKYAKIFTKELNYIPDSRYFDIEKDIQAYIILNNTINMADFISYETNNGKESIIKNTTDINKKKELIDKLTIIKRGSEGYGK